MQKEIILIIIHNRKRYQRCVSLSKRVQIKSSANTDIILFFVQVWFKVVNYLHITGTSNLKKKSIVKVYFIEKKKKSHLSLVRDGVFNKN